jgi:hypothetical protein
MQQRSVAAGFKGRDDKIEQRGVNMPGNRRMDARIIRSDHVSQGAYEVSGN